MQKPWDWALTNPAAHRKQNFMFRTKAHSEGARHIMLTFCNNE